MLSYRFLTVCLLSVLFPCTSLALTSNSTYHINHQTGRQIVGIAQAASQVIMDKHLLINSSIENKSQLFGEPFLQQTRERFYTLHQRPFPSTDHPYIQALLNSIISVMEDNRSLIMDQRIKDKGLIPATFLVQLSSYFSKSHMPITLKLSGITHLTINPMNRPGPAELKAIQILQANPDQKKSIVFSGPSGSTHVFQPQHFQPRCQSCHQETSVLPGELYGGISLTIHPKPQYNQPSIVSGPLTLKSKNRLSLAVSPYKHHLIYKDHKFSGPWVTYLQRITELSGIQFSLMLSPPDRLHKLLDSKQAELAFPLNPLSTTDTPYTIVNGAGLIENPGLCFKSQEFVPYLHMKENWNNYLVIVPTDFAPLQFPELRHSSIHTLHGHDYHQRAVGLLTRNRANAVFIDNSLDMYRESLKKGMPIACSAFHGRESGKHLIAGSHLDQTLLSRLEQSIKQIGLYRIWYSQNIH